MTTIRRFEDLEIWQLARELNKLVNPLLGSLQSSRNFEIKNQLEDALGSAMDNIAEGFERDGNREFIQFLSMSKGSLGESRSQLYRIFDKGLISSIEFDQLQKQCLVLASKIANFMTYLRNVGHRGTKFRKPGDQSQI
jgi:four helix bundle protein